MAAISVTANSITTTATDIQAVKVAEAVTAGAILYKKTDGTWALAQADGTAIESGSTSDAMGMALGAAATGQYVCVLKSGSVTGGFTVVKGTDYYLHTTAGGFGVFSELGSTNFVTRIGQASSTTAITLSFSASGLALT